MQVNIVQKLIVKAYMEAVSIEWDCPVCECTNIFNDDFNEVQICGECGFEISEDIWTADEVEQEIKLDGELVDRFKSVYFNEEDKEQEEEEDEEV